MVQRRKKRTRPPRSTARGSLTASRAKKRRLAEQGRSGSGRAVPRRIVAEGKFKGAYMLDSLRDNPQTQLYFVFAQGTRVQAMAFLLEYPGWGVKNFFITPVESWPKMQRIFRQLTGEMPYPMIEIPFEKAKSLVEYMLEINADKGLYHQDYRAAEDLIKARILDAPAQAADISDLLGADKDRMHIVDMRNWEETMSEMVP